VLGLYGKLRFAKTALGDEDAESWEVRDGKLPHHHRFRTYVVLSAALQKAADLFYNRRNHKNFHASSTCAASLYRSFFSTFSCCGELPNAAHQVRRAAGARHERTLFAVTCMRLLGGVASGDDHLASSSAKGPEVLPHAVRTITRSL
jgi:hypothetical protein